MYHVLNINTSSVVRVGPAAGGGGDGILRSDLKAKSVVAGDEAAGRDAVVGGDGGDSTMCGSDLGLPGKTGKL
jgi:hypothetical protein